MIEPRQLVRHEPAIRTLTIVSVAGLSPSFRRITLTGPELEGFASLGPADHVKLFVGEDDRRDYTPRAFRAATANSEAELDIDIFLHGEGPASTWVRQARAGHTVRIGGPRGSRLPPLAAKKVILGADESSLPAFARWIEASPLATEVFGFVELDNPSDAAYLDPDHIHKARVVWLRKSEGVLERAIRGFGPIDENTFVWVAGEATTLIPLRRYLRRERGLPKEQVSIDGYWKRGEANRDHHSPIDPEDPED